MKNLLQRLALSGALFAAGIGLAGCVQTRKPVSPNKELAIEYEKIGQIKRNNPKDFENLKDEYKINQAQIESYFGGKEKIKEYFPGIDPDNLNDNYRALFGLINREINKAIIDLGSTSNR